MPWPAGTELANTLDEVAKAELEQAECQNCGKKFPVGSLCNPIPDLEQRVTPGESMPVGECPGCGALCHVVKEVRPCPNKDK